MYFLFKGVSVFSYFKSELTRGYLLERDQEKFTERRQRVYTFMKTPRELEKVLNQYFHVFWRLMLAKGVIRVFLVDYIVDNALNKKNVIQY